MRKTIKGLSNEIEKLMSDLEKLKKLNKEYDQALEQTSRLTDAILACVAEKYGEKVDDAGYRLQFLRERTKTILNEYEVSAKWDDLVTTFGIIKRVENETESATEKPAEAGH